MDMAVIAEKVSQARQENAKKTRDYSWTQRTEVKLKGETKSLKTEIVRYTVDGEVQKTPIDETSAMLDFLNKASVSPDGDGRKLDASDVVQAGDRMSVWIDANHKMTKTEVSTQHDGSDVKLETDHATTPDGLDYVARTVIVVPDKGVEMTVENFSYQKE
jgi:hypothetical protein